MVNPNLRLSWSRWFVGYNSSGLPLQPTIRERKEKETLEIGRSVKASSSLGVRGLVVEATATSSLPR